METNAGIDHDRDDRDVPHPPDDRDVPHPPDDRDVPHPPDDRELEAFKADVRIWLEVDTSIRQLREAARERREAKRALTSRILAFMTKHNIEDLSTRSGRLRAQVAYVRSPLSHQVIRSRIDNLYASDAAAAQQLSGILFGNRERSERTSLRRLT
jgi:hypothetical protein